MVVGPFVYSFHFILKHPEQHWPSTSKTLCVNTYHHLNILILKTGFQESPLKDVHLIYPNTLSHKHVSLPISSLSRQPTLTRFPYLSTPSLSSAVTFPSFKNYPQSCLVSAIGPSCKLPQQGATRGPIFCSLFLKNFNPFSTWHIEVMF